MGNAISSILRAATRGAEPLSVISAPTHERYQTCQAKTGHRFYFVQNKAFIKWNKSYAPVPDNVVILNEAMGDYQLPSEVDFDVVLSHHKSGSYQLLGQIAKRLHLNHIFLEHTLPPKDWPKSYIQQLKQMSAGDHHIFISEFSREAWGFKQEEAQVIHHGIDTDLFSHEMLPCERKPHILGVANDYLNRNWCLNFDLWKEATKGLTVHLVGNTPGLSKPASSVYELAQFYRSSQVFCNTSLISPVPTALLEAMSSSCCVVTSGTCMIPDIVKHGVNGLIANTPQEMAKCLKAALADAAMRKELGDAARRTILERFSLSRFVSEWDATFREVANKPYGI